MSGVHRLFKLGLVAIVSNLAASIVRISSPENGAKVALDIFRPLSVKIETTFSLGPGEYSVRYSLNGRTHMDNHTFEDTLELEWIAPGDYELVVLVVEDWRSFSDCQSLFRESSITARVIFEVVSVPGIPHSDKGEKQKHHFILFSSLMQPSQHFLLSIRSPSWSG